MQKDEVAQILSEIGLLLDIKGENPFKVRAYSNAARIIENCPEPIERLVTENRLGELKGVGEALQQKICELVQTGQLGYHRELRASIPEGVLQMLTLPGLGPKKVKALFEKLGIQTLEALE